jgi:hypothetical protein
MRLRMASRDIASPISSISESSLTMHEELATFNTTIDLSLDLIWFETTPDTYCRQPLLIRGENRATP